MVRCWSCILVLAALLGGGSSAVAANLGEARAFNAASRAFTLGTWDYAETNFATFVRNFPDSPLVPKAVLYRARARFHLKQFQSAIELLKSNESRAGDLAEQYLYWIARCHFENGDYPEAAGHFARLVRDFPESEDRAEACVGEATAYARMQQWPRVIELLTASDKVFQQIAAGTTNNHVVAGHLLLGEAGLATTNFAVTSQALQWLQTQTLRPDLAWRRGYLDCRVHSARGEGELALAGSTNLVAIATEARDPELTAESFALRGAILEQMRRYDDAVAAYRNNLTTNAPVAYQQGALLKMTQIRLAQNRIADAVKLLDDYWNAHSTSAAADMALVTLGELRLRQYLNETNRPTAASTNLLREAVARFDAVLNGFPSSPVAGKALLGKGWCFWVDGQMPSAEELFQKAAETLPFSIDQAVARFKWADAQWMQTNFAGALTNYRYVVETYAHLPEAREQVLELALYQSVRTALAITNLDAASAALGKILDWYPNGFAGDRGLLLTGQGLARQNDVAAARRLFAEFAERYPESPLLPEVKLAVARTYEREGHWAAATEHYGEWIGRFTNHTQLPRAQFSRGWSLFMAGDETNALVVFTNFITQFPTNELAPQAQWWVADHHFRQGAWDKAEFNYQFRKEWASSDLYFPALMMAGRSAMARDSYKDAISYFTNLTGTPTCPREIRLQAAFAAGDAFMSWTTPGATNRRALLEEALSWFQSVTSVSATNPLLPLAWGRIGDTYKELGALEERYYSEAKQAYQRVLTNQFSSVATRSQAKIGMGLVTEKQAERRSGAEQAALRQEALGHYLDVFVQNNLRDGEQPDLFWVREAGLNAARMAEQLQQWQQAINIYEQMQRELPSANGVWQNRIAHARRQLALEKL